MKILILLAALQTGLLLSLLTTTLSTDGKPDATDMTTPVAAANVDPARLPRGSSDCDRLTEAQLRAMFSEELTAQLAAARRSDMEGSAVEDAAPASETGYRYQLAAVTQKLDLYESVGVVSDEEMHELQSEIMALNEPHRTAALRRLVRALNSGTLKGRF